MGKIMVTGALGNVGRYVAEYAISNGQEVVVADLDVTALEKKYQGKAECIYFDFTDQSSYEEALKEVDRVFIMRPPHLGRPEDLKPFIERLKTKPSMQMICFLSLLGIEKNPMPPHHKIEKYIEQSGLPYCHIRPSFFMQNISGVHAFEIKYFDNIVVPVKKALTSFIDARDIGELTAEVLTHPQQHINQAYSITGPKAMDYYEVATLLSNELERKIQYSNPSPRLAKKYWIKIRKLDKAYASVMGMLYIITRLGNAKKVTNTYEKIMNKKPRTFTQFIRENRKAWINNQ